MFSGELIENFSNNFFVFVDIFGFPGVFPPLYPVKLNFSISKIFLNRNFVIIIQFYVHFFIR